MNARIATSTPNYVTLPEKTEERHYKSYASNNEPRNCIHDSYIDLSEQMESTRVIGGAACRTIYRRGVPPDFYYVDSGGDRITSAAVLAYIASLVIPPKYDGVEIYAAGRGGQPCAPAKLTYIGIDPAGRTQYGYSAAWKARAARSKFADLVVFGTTLPRIRQAVDATLADPRASLTPTLEFCIALIVRVMISCHFRLGNTRYKDLYKHYGVSTLEVRHVRPTATGVRIMFIGKKGCKNACDLADALVAGHLANLMRGKLPKAPIFTYGHPSEPRPVAAADINAWMRHFGVDITSKMFRTFAANIMLIDHLAAVGRDADPDIASMTARQRTKLLNEALDDVSCTVHNTRAVCKKEYIHPGIVDMFVNHPRAFKTRFMAPGGDTEVAFIIYLRGSSPTRRG